MTYGIYTYYIKMIRCNIAMTERPRQDVIDSFFGGVVTAKYVNPYGKAVLKSLLEQKQWLLLLFLWAKDDPVTSVAQIMEISRPSPIDAFQWLREVFSSNRLQNPIKLGGPGKIVQTSHFSDTSPR